jgi:hypothetical protein
MLRHMNLFVIPDVSRMQHSDPTSESDKQKPLVVEAPKHASTVIHDFALCQHSKRGKPIGQTAVLLATVGQYASCAQC